MLAATSGIVGSLQNVVGRNSEKFAEWNKNNTIKKSYGQKGNNNHGINSKHRSNNKKPGTYCNTVIRSNTRTKSNTRNRK